MRLPPLLLLASVLALASPLAGADAPPLPHLDLRLQPPAAPVAPGEAVELAANLTLECLGEGSLAAGRVDFEAVAAPTWLTAEAEPASVAFGETPCAATPLRFPATVRVRVAEDAPAFMPEQVRLQARHLAPDAQGRAEADAMVEAALAGSVRVEATMIELTGEPQTPLSASIRLVNEANAPMRVVFEMPPASGKWQVVTPQSVTLHPRGAPGGGDVKEAILQIQTPYANGYVDEDLDTVLRATATPAIHPDAAPPRTTEIPVRVHAEGYYVPGPAPALALAVFAALAAARTRTRR